MKDFGFSVIKSLWKSTWRFLVLISVIALLAYSYRAHQLRFPSSYDAYLLAPVVPISTQIDGKVKSIDVLPGRFVQKGRSLLTLMDDEKKLALKKARLKLEKVRALYESSLEAIHIDDEKVLQAQQKLQLQKDALSRARALSKRNVISDAALEKAQALYTEVLQNLKIANLSLKKDHASYGLFDINDAKNAVQIAKLQLSYTRVHAPTSGFITYFHLTEGQYVHTGDTLFGQIDAGHFYLQANMLEMFLPYVKVGQPVLFTLRMYPGKRYHGVVSALGYAISAGNVILSATPLVQPAFDWVHIARRFPVYIKVTDAHPFKTQAFRSGASAWVSIDTTRKTAA